MAPGRVGGAAEVGPFYGYGLREERLGAGDQEGSLFGGFEGARVEMDLVAI